MEHSRIEEQRPQHLLNEVNRIFFSFLFSAALVREREGADGAGSLVRYRSEEDTRRPPLLGKPAVCVGSDETNAFVGSDAVTAQSVADPGG